MYSFAVFYLFAASCYLLLSVAYALAAKAVGADIEEICVFGGPTVARFHLGGILWVVNVVPGLGGHIKFREKSKDEFSKGFFDVHPLHRAAIYASGSLALVALALACLGPLGGARSIWHGFPQIIRGGLSPLAQGVPLVRSLFQLIQVRSYLAAFGIIAAKMAAYRLLPLPMLDGGEILQCLIGWRVRIPGRIVHLMRFVGVVVTIFLGCGWLFAIARVVIYG